MAHSSVPCPNVSLFILISSSTPDLQEPRIINRTCDKCLTYAGQQKQKLVDDHTVRYVIEHEMLGISD